MQTLKDIFRHISAYLLFARAPVPNHYRFGTVRGFAPRETPTKKVQRLPQWDTPRGVPLSCGAPRIDLKDEAGIDQFNAY
jgi:hypothetical protein